MTWPDQDLDHAARPSRSLRVEATPYEIGGPYRLDLIDVRTGETLASLGVGAGMLLSEQLHREALAALDAAGAPASDEENM